MTPDDAFLAAVLAGPDDDTPRLVYADWLEEHGQGERAEFVRAQCELARGRCESEVALNTGALCIAPLCRWCVLRRRERELLEAHGRDWLAVVPGGLVPADVGFGTAADALLRDGTFRRGFVESVALPCAAWLARGPALVRACPLRRVRLSDRHPARAYGGHCWFAQGLRYPGPDVVPRELVPHLSDAVRGHNGSAVGDVAQFLTDADALAALSDACLAWARLPQHPPGLLPLPPLAGLRVEVGRSLPRRPGWMWHPARRDTVLVTEEVLALLRGTLRVAGLHPDEPVSPRP